MPTQNPDRGGNRRVPELTSEQLDKLAAKVFALMLRDLRIAKERFRGTAQSKVRTTRGGY